MKYVAFIFVLGCIVSTGYADDKSTCLSHTEPGRPTPMTQWNPDCAKGGEGCDFMNIQFCQLCGFGDYDACAATTTSSPDKQTCLSHTEPGKPSPMTRWNPYCGKGAVGCDFLGIDYCQLCGFGSYPDCDEPMDPLEAECYTKSATTGESAEWDVTCVKGGLGCGAFGITFCRYCGFGPYASIPCTVKSPCGDDWMTQLQQCHDNLHKNPTYDVEFDVACFDGGVGCNAFGIKCCKFCKAGGGDATYPACSIPWGRRLTGDMLFMQ